MTTNLKCSSVIHHETSNIHKAAREQKKADCMKANGQSMVLFSPIGRCLANLDDEAQARVRCKSDVWY